jgi:hypothetical protein
MKTHIIVHLMPYEIDWFEWQAKQLKMSSHYLESDDEITLNVTLNLNFTDWEKSKIPKQYFIEKFNQCLSACFDWCTVIKDINIDKTCMGCADKRRSCIRTSNDADAFIYLDADLIFSVVTLKLLLDSAKSVNSDYYIISPQIPKLWDDSWNVLMNSSYANYPWDNKTFIDPYTVTTTIYGNPVLHPISSFKLGGGWFNLISTNLLRLIDLPDSFGPYGPDDTFLMYGAQILKQAGYDIQQYVVENLVVSENHKYRITPYTDLLVNTNDRNQFRADSDKKLIDEVQNLQKIYLT